MLGIIKAQQNSGTTINHHRHSGHSFGVPRHLLKEQHWNPMQPTKVQQAFEIYSGSTAHLADFGIDGSRIGR
ncbi:hypothetical protein D3C87_1709710 [compost metagenome]